MQKSESDYNLIDWWKKVVFQNYANFTGRARRAEYWYFVLGQLCILIPFYILLLTNIDDVEDELFGVYSIVLVLFFLGTFIPGLAVTVRRLHDINKSGWNYLFVFVPFGSIILLVWMCTEGHQMPNRHGLDPKEPEGPVFDFENK